MHLDRSDHLNRAERHIAGARERISVQCALIEKMAASGHDTKLAKQLLDAFNQTLKCYRAHRDLLTRHMVV
jgi:hypothetical protein